MELLLRPVPPFDFDLSASLFSGGDGRRGEYQAGIYRQAVTLGHRATLVELRSLGSVDEPLLSARIEPDNKISQGDAGIEGMIRRLFNLDLDLAPFYQAARADRVISYLAERLRGLRSPSTATPFQALILSIVEQQISLKVAWSLQGRMIERFGDPITWEERRYNAFPRPETLALASREELRACGLSYRKSEYIIEASARVAEGLDLEGLRALDDREIIRELCLIRGVGVWTAELTMVRGLQRFDAFPAQDLGLRRAIAHYYHHDRKISAEEARQTALAWKGWRGLAGFYLIMAEQRRIEVPLEREMHH
jgi:DNA-3-methyladenine glycosylase II